MPVRRPMVFQSMPLSASFWSSAPMTTISEAPSSATIARLSLSQMMTRVGDAQDDGRHRHRVEAEENMRHEVFAGHGGSPRWRAGLRRGAGRCQGEREVALDPCYDSCFRHRKEDCREPDPFHQPRSAREAARLYPCGRGHRARPDRLHLRPARHRPRRQGRRAIFGAGGADLREPEERARRGRRQFRARGEAQQLPRRHRHICRSSARCATAIWPTSDRPASTTLAISGLAREARCSRSRRSRCCRQPRDAKPPSTKRRSGAAARPATKARRRKRK